MSLDATRWAWRQQVRPTHKLVLLSLADRAGEQHECRPSIMRLEIDTGLYRETIMEAVSEMESNGLIAVARSNGRGNRYVLVGVESRHDQSGKADRYGKADQSGKADSTSREKPTTTSREKPTQNLPSEPIKESVNHKRAFDALGYLLSAGVSESVASDWLVLRKQKKATATETAMRRIEGEAAKAGMSLNAALETCCARGWQGFEAAWVQQKSPAQIKSDKQQDWLNRLTGRDSNDAIDAPARLVG